MQDLSMDSDDGAQDQLREYIDLVYVFSVDAKFSPELCTALSVFNHEVLAFSDFNEFNLALAARAPDAVIVDIDSDEGRILKHAIANKVKTGAPVIYVSSHDDFNERLHAVQEGAEGYFIKPLDVQALSLWIDEKIARNEVRAYRILVVDDDDFFLSFFDAVLSGAGMQVKALIDPCDILETMKKFRPELVLTDLHMPHCNGIEMAKIIRQNNQYVAVPIVFLSSETELQKQIGALQIGADDFLTKPIDPEKLISSISTRAERYRNLRKHIHG